MSLIDSDQEGGEGRSRSRSRSRSPLTSRHDSESMENLSPESKKFQKLLRMELAPMKKQLYKLVDTTGQVKTEVDHVKRAVGNIGSRTTGIEEQFRKATKADPKSSLSAHVIQFINRRVFNAVKKGLTKDVMKNAVFQELKDNGLAGMSAETAVKSVASIEFSHLKSHLRTLISQDLNTGNVAEFPKTVQYLRSHLREDEVEEDTHEFLVIIAFCMAKFENSRPVPLTDVDQGNKRMIDQHVDHLWAYVKLKFDKYQDRGDTHGAKLKSIIDGFGYKQAKKGDGSVRRSLQ